MSATFQVGEASAAAPPPHFASPGYAGFPPAYDHSFNGGGGYQQSPQPQMQQSSYPKQPTPQQQQQQTPQGQQGQQPPQQMPRQFSPMGGQNSMNGMQNGMPPQNGMMQMNQNSPGARGPLPSPHGPSPLAAEQSFASPSYPSSGMRSTPQPAPPPMSQPMSSGMPSQHHQQPPQMSQSMMGMAQGGMMGMGGMGMQGGGMMPQQQAQQQAMMMGGGGMQQQQQPPQQPNFTIVNTHEMPPAFPQFHEMIARHNPKLAHHQYEKPRRQLHLPYPTGTQATPAVEPPSFAFIPNTRHYEDRFDRRNAPPPPQPVFPPQMAGMVRKPQMPPPHGYYPQQFAQQSPGAFAAPPAAVPTTKPPTKKARAAQAKKEQAAALAAQQQQQQQMAAAAARAEQQQKMMMMQQQPCSSADFAQPFMMNGGGEQKMNGQPNGQYGMPQQFMSPHHPQMMPGGDMGGPPGMMPMQSQMQMSSFNQQCPPMMQNGQHVPPDFNGQMPMNMPPQPKMDLSQQVKMEQQNMDQPSGMQHCPGCSQDPSAATVPFIQCAGASQNCRRIYHLECTGLNSTAFEMLREDPRVKWVCGICIGAGHQLV